MWPVFLIFGICILVLNLKHLTVVGKSGDKCNEYIQIAKTTRIKRGLGKIEVSPDEFPHMAALLSGDNIKCGGSLISDQYILTTVHCTTRSPLTKVRLGSNGISNSKNTTDIQDISISKIIIHPDFKPPSIYNNIALLKLRHKVHFTKSVRPACLQTDPNLNVNSVIGTGWGSIIGVMKPVSQLHKVTFDLFTNEECQNVYKSSRYMVNGITDAVICYGGKTESKGKCNGIGGPLQILHQDQTDIYNIVGILIIETGCDMPGIPDIATRVSSYISWIESVVWP